MCSIFFAPPTKNKNINILYRMSLLARVFALNKMLDLLKSKKPTRRHDYDPGEDPYAGFNTVSSSVAEAEKAVKDEKIPEKEAEKLVKKAEDLAAEQKEHWDVEFGGRKKGYNKKTKGKKTKGKKTKGKKTLRRR